MSRRAGDDPDGLDGLLEDLCGHRAAEWPDTLPALSAADLRAPGGPAGDGRLTLLEWLEATFPGVSAAPARRATGTALAGVEFCRTLFRLAESACGMRLASTRDIAERLPAARCAALWCRAVEISGYELPGDEEA